MRSRLLRILRRLGTATVLGAAAVAILVVLAPTARAHVGPHDPTVGSTLTYVTGAQDKNCATKAPGSISCPKFKITNCQGADTTRDGWYARSNPPDGTPIKAMLVIFSGGGGTSYWQAQASAGSVEDQRVDAFLKDLRNEGFAIFQVRWGVDWPKADPGQNDGLHIACRPARIVESIHQRHWVPLGLNPATGVCGFCVMGTSGGSSATAWSLTHFMTGSYVDAVFPTGGPPHAALAKGCAPTGPSEVGYGYDGTSIQQIDNSFLASSVKECELHDASYRDTWDRHSIDTTQSAGDHSHPTTRVHLLDGQLDELRVHGYDWMLRMWQAESAYTSFEIIPGGQHSIYNSQLGMDRLEAAVTLTDTAKFSACNNGLDDDWDGQADGADAGCASTSDATEKGGAACDNGLDDDGDGFIDFRTEYGDGGCSDASDTSETGGGGGPTISIGDVAVDETNAGSFQAFFPVTLSAQSETPVTVQYQTQNDTATAPSDYLAVSPPQTLTFAAGETSKNAPVTINGDTTVESNEEFRVVLSAPSGATISGDGIGVGLIQNDDSAALPTLAVSDASTSEGSPAAFQVTLTGTSAQTVSVEYATANGTATQPDDYTSTSGTLTWLSGTSGAQTVNVPVASDAVDEPAEAFTLNLTSPVNASVTDGQGTATIAGQSSTPTISIADASVEEVDDGATSTLRFMVSLSAPASQDVSFRFTTVNGTAAAPGDFNARTGFTLVIPAGNVSRQVAVVVKGDSLDEGDESFTGTISDPVGATIADGSAIGSIVDDDDPPAGPLPERVTDDRRLRRGQV